jgi:tubulin polyglutamylase complex subunit 2
MGFISIGATNTPVSKQTSLESTRIRNNFDGVPCSTDNDVRKVGQIYIPHLIEISLMRENIELNDPSLNSSLTYLSTLHRSAIAENHRSSKISKIFELKSILDMAKVCLVYESPESNPKIFLFEVVNLKWKFLADSFSEYLRMCIAHMGLPYWELCFSSSCQLPPWTEQLFLLLAPHLLEKNEPRRGLNVKQNSDCPIYNVLVLEASVFRAKPTKCSRQNPKQKKF